MPCGKNIIFALFGIGKSAQSALFADRAERILAVGQKFIGIHLMPDIENNLIDIEIKDIAKRDRQFDNAEIGREVAAVFVDGPYDLIAYFRAKLFQLFVIQIFYIAHTPSLQRSCAAAKPTIPSSIL